jgi:hypothetical protein
LDYANNDACLSDAKPKNATGSLVAAGKLPAATPNAFYRQVNRTQDAMNFVPEVWSICKPAYAGGSQKRASRHRPVVLSQDAHGRLL